MKKVVTLIATFALLSGCAPKFYNNGPIDASSVSQSISIKLIDSENSTFHIYKINLDTYALVSVRDQHRASSLDAINNAIIFGQKDIEALRKVCEQIIANYDKQYEKETQVIEYHLVLNMTQLEGRSSTLVSNYMVSTNTQISEIQRVIFRLQFVRESSDVSMPSKNIEYMYGAITGRMDIKEIKALLSDLQK